VARKSKHRRLVLYDESLDNIVGIINTRTLLLHPEVDMDEVIEMPSFVPESMNLLQLYISLQRQKRRATIVLDEFGTTAGFLTMEDILEEMVGDLRREDDPVDREITRLGPDRWLLKGKVRIDDFLEEFPALAEVAEVDTMGGMLTHELEMIPKEGDSAECFGLRLTALEVDERRVLTLLVERVKP
jgi:CBS domain containing-hemolysin-like protein